MDFDFAAIGYGSLVGLSLGLTGSGGSILAIPILVYGLGLPVSQAIVVSLLMVSTIALFGAVRQTFENHVDWQSAFMFSLAGMLVSPIVIQMAHSVNETLRIVLFAALMLFVASRMAFENPKHVASHSASYKIRHRSLSERIKIVFGGSAAGILAGFFGVGGGFIIVPLLSIIFHMPYRIAVGTSLASIFLISIAAVGGAFMKDIVVDWPLFFNFVLGGGIGMLAGSALVNIIHERRAKIIFAALTSILAIFMLIDKLYIHQGGLS